MRLDLIAGVDPGLKGALHCELGTWPMRDLQAALDVLAADGRPVRFVVENTINVRNRRAKTVQTTERNFGELVFRLSQVGIVERVEPKTWQAALGLSKKGESYTDHKRRIQAAMARVIGAPVALACADAAAIWYWATRRGAACAA